MAPHSGKQHLSGVPLAHLQRPSPQVEAEPASVGSGTSRALAELQTPRNVRCADHDLQLVCPLFIPKVQQAVHFLVSDVCDELTNQELQDLKFQSRLPTDPGVTFRDPTLDMQVFVSPRVAQNSRMGHGWRVRVGLWRNASLECVDAHCLKALGAAWVSKPNQSPTSVTCTMRRFSSPLVAAPATCCPRVRSSHQPLRPLLKCAETFGRLQQLVAEHADRPNL